MDIERPTWTSAAEGEPVAAYETPHGAELAAERLTDAGFAPEAIAIRPLADRPLPGWRFRARGDDGPSGLTVGASVISGATTAFAAVALGWSMRVIVITAIAVALGIGALIYAATRWWVARASAQARADRRVLARAFEVRCRVDPSRARVSARWWNPEARPTPRAG